MHLNLKLEHQNVTQLMIQGKQNLFLLQALMKLNQKLLKVSINLDFIWVKNCLLTIQQNSCILSQDQELTKQTQLLQDKNLRFILWEQDSINKRILHQLYQDQEHMLILQKNLKWRHHHLVSVQAKDKILEAQSSKLLDQALISYPLKLLMFQTLQCQIVIQILNMFESSNSLHWNLKVIWLNKKKEQWLSESKKNA